MASFFKNNPVKKTASERQLLVSKYAGARSNLLLVIGFSLINIVLLVAQNDVYFLFSAFIPYFLMSLGMLFCGMYPEATQSSEYAELVLFERSAFAFFAIVCAVILALYVLSWIFSKKHRVGWLIFALVIFSVDTLLMLLLGGISADSIIDIAFHAWVIVSLANGIASHYKLKKLPQEEVVVEFVQEALPEQNTEL